MTEINLTFQSRPVEIVRRSFWARHQRELLVSLLLVLASHVFVLWFAKLARWEKGYSGFSLTEFCTLDCHWYAAVAASGYEAQPFREERHDAASWHFLPAFPLAIVSVAKLLHLPYRLAAVVTSKIFLFTAILAFLWMVRDETNGWSDTVLAGTLVAFNPYLIYAHGGYSESLYFTLAAAGFALLRRHRWVGSGMAGALLSATRIVGVVFAVPYVIACLRAYGVRRLLREQKLNVLLGLLLCPAGLSLYLLFLYHRTGDALAPMHSFTAWGLQSGNPITVLGEAFHHGHWTKYFAATAIFGWIVSAWLAWERHYEMAAFLALCILMPVTAEVGGMPRFVWWQPPMLYAVYVVLKRHPKLQMVYAAFAGGMAATMIFLWTVKSSSAV